MLIVGARTKNGMVLEKQSREAVYENRHSISCLGACRLSALIHFVTVIDRTIRSSDLGISCVELANPCSETQSSNEQSAR